jgi:pimeloyl-ACP methyl ester carboxylesterase
MSAVTLPDGRELDVRVSGPDGGTPLVYHHGTPGSCVQEHEMQREAHARGLRLVTYSRAGYGSSTRHAGRSVADVAADIAAVLDHLGAAVCLVIGKSGGGPHALATAALLPDRVAGVASIAGVGPYDAEGLDFLSGMGQMNIEEFGVALQGEDQLRGWLEHEALGLRGVTVAGMIESLSTLLPESDRAALSDEYGTDLLAQLDEGICSGVDGWLDDDLAMTRDWSFELGDIAVPAFIWQGTADLMVPVAHGEWLAEAVPGAVAHIEDGHGHLSIQVGAIGRILDELTRTLPGR